jgi:hypothetical protein
LLNIGLAEARDILEALKEEQYKIMKVELTESGMVKFKKLRL